MPKGSARDSSIWSRRSALWAAAAVFFASTAGRGAQAAADNASKGAAWILGDRLSLAALLYNQGAPADETDRFLNSAKSIGRDLGVEIKPFPVKATDASAATADVIHYLIAGDGAAVGAALAQKFDDAHGALFEVSVKSNLLILLYAPGDNLGRSIAEVIAGRMPATGAPQQLWTGVVAAVAQKRSADDVKNAVFQMHKDVANYFIPGSG